MVPMAFSRLTTFSCLRIDAIVLDTRRVLRLG